MIEGPNPFDGFADLKPKAHFETVTSSPFGPEAPPASRRLLDRPPSNRRCCASSRAPFVPSLLTYLQRGLLSIPCRSGSRSEKGFSEDVFCMQKRKWVCAAASRSPTVRATKHGTLPRIRRPSRGAREASWSWGYLPAAPASAHLRLPGPGPSANVMIVKWEDEADDR